MTRERPTVGDIASAWLVRRFVDRNAETWQYEASTNPSVQADLYEGDASTGTLEVVAITPRLQPQQGSFAGDGGVQGFRGAFQTGADVVEVLPDRDVADVTALLASHVIMEILAVAALA